MIVSILNAVGLALQLLGAGIAVYGYRRDWNENASPTDRFMAPLVKLLDRAFSLVRRFVRRLSRRPAPRVVAVAGVAAGVGAAGHARLSVLPGPISSDLDAAAAVAELDNRIRNLIERVNTLEHGLADETTERKTVVGRVDGDIRALLAAREEEERRRSVRGLRIEAFGFLVLTIGALIQGIGAFFGS